MKPRELPAQALLQDLFKYNLQTGQLLRKIKTSNSTRAGDIVGSTESSGYLQVKVNRVSYRVHRIIYKLLRGDFNEELQIDHINRNRADNRIENLRLVTTEENCRNQKRRTNNTSGHSGVYWFCVQNNWRATIYINGRKAFLGSFKKKEDAVAARKKAEKEAGYSDTHGT